MTQRAEFVPTVEDEAEAQRYAAVTDLSVEELRSGAGAFLRMTALSSQRESWIVTRAADIKAAALCEPSFEWCVMASYAPHEPHRGPMSEQEARNWVEEWERPVSQDGDGGRVGMFFVARRTVGPWEKV